jgi:tetratricopeptide (TPR) repeat protein
MSYVFGRGLTYSDYLQSQDSIRGEIRTSTRELIATREQLAHEQIKVIDRVSSEISEGFEEVSLGLAQVREGLSVLNATFEWGFSEMLTVMGRVADSLEELIRIAKNPSKTWAYEQFDDARDAYRKNLYAEAIEYLNRAIHGYGGQPGYELEYRFYYWLGTIRIGSFRNNSSEIVDLAEAKTAYLKAARYSEHDYPGEAAKAFLGAGQAAYAQGEVQDALTFSQRAVSLDPALAEGHFQLAKVLMHRNEAQAALKPLKQAIRFDWRYTLKSSTDRDFTPHQDKVGTLIESLRTEAKELFDQKFAEFDANIRSLEQLRVQKFVLADGSGIERLRKLAKDIESAATAKTYCSYLQAIKRLGSAEAAISQANDTLAHMHQQREHERAERETAQKLSGVEKASKMAKIAMWLSIAGLLCCGLPSAVGLILGIVALKDLTTCDSPEIRTRTNFGGAQTKAIVAVVVGALSTLLWGVRFLATLLDSIGRAGH